ncbi:homoserine dehydrogenase [Achlya hypogyna]|uniref:homoserine dehydrogenase n=1 Tax=Achlya hypogyna TaxID=1202772 RepID=A0A1V9ZSW2_ACHHY|nr:homoserine dehydrogenase [Achlya hypogyna]
MAWWWTLAAVAIVMALWVQTRIYELHPHPGQTLCEARKVGLVIVGHGVVSRGLIAAIVAHEATTNQRVDFCGARLHIVAVGDATAGGFMQVSTGFSMPQAQALYTHGVESATLEDGDDNEIERVGTLGDVVMSMLLFGHCDRYIVVDCAAHGGHWKDLVLAKKSGFGLAFSNRLHLTGDYNETYARIALDRSQKRSRLVAYEATVGSGLPVLHTLERVAATGDHVHRVEARFSDANAYILDAIHHGSSWSDAVISAYENGLTEADPRDDLSGRVAARKMVILARQLGYKANLASVHVQDLVPAAMRNVSLSAFFAHLPQLDHEFEAQMNKSKETETILMYTGRVDGLGHIAVGLERYPRTSSFHRLLWTESVVAITTTWFPDAIVLKGAGAGTNGTVAALMADIAKLSCVLFTSCDVDS